MSELQLRPLQAAAIDAVSAAFRAGFKNVMVQAPCGFGKCHGIDTPILMADGTIRAVQDVCTGDRLLGPDGTVRTVLSLGRGAEQMYQVTPIKGDPYRCNASHILSLRKQGEDGLVLASGRAIARSDDVISVSVVEFLASNKTAQTVLKGWRAPAVEFPDGAKASLPIPPYILGVWLGDGASREPAVTSLPSKMIDAWTQYALSLGLKISIDDNNGNRCPTYHARTERGSGANPVTAALRLLNLICNKHIPQAYKTASAQDRLSVIAGLIDSDGHHIKGCYDWISKHERLARDFAFLVRSVGLSCYMSKVTKTIKSIGFSGEYWRCAISGDTTKIPCLDKPADARVINKRNLVHRIAIKPIGVGEYYGFQIDGDHLYLLGDFTVCHNTELATAMLIAADKNLKKAAFICDRLALVAQTGERFDKYGLAHGVLQAQHWRWRPWERIQLCSVQTLERRGWPDDVSLVMVDEAHVLHGSVKKQLEKRNRFAVGLSGTPVTKGLGKYFDCVVNAATTNQLIAENLLVPYRIFAASEPDMEGVKVVKGEYEEKESEKRSMPIVGDCVAEYLKHGDGQKFICFAVSVTHAEEIQRQFLAAGIVAGLYTYRQKDAEREASVTEFRKPDSYIRGLISIEALTRGFDVADIGVLILARPLRSSLAVHLQMFGRVLRTADGKTGATILCHSGNCVRFWNSMHDFFENGASVLDDGKRKEKKKAEKREKKPMKCPKCAAVHAPQPSCPACGFVYPKVSNVEHEAGELKALSSGQAMRTEDKRQLYAELKTIAVERNWSDGRLAHVFKDIAGTWPNNYRDVSPAEPSQATRNKVISLTIRFIKSKAGREWAAQKNRADKIDRDNGVPA